MGNLQKVSVANFLSFDKTQKFLESTLADRKGEFISNLIAITDSDAKLQECDPGQLMKCALNASALNLPLNKNLGFAYVIAYKGVPSFQIGYKGLIQLAIRSGQYEFLNATEIREGEIKRNKVTGEITFEGEKPGGLVVGYLAYLKLKSGFQASVYMTEVEIEKHATRFSRSYQYDKKSGGSTSKWSDPDARPKMALKTVLKALLGTYGIMSTDMQRAFENDTEVEITNGFRGVDYAEFEDQPEPSAAKAETQTTIQL